MSDERKAAEVVVGCGGLLAVMLLAYPATVLLDAYLLYAMWGWFVVPTFHVPVLGFALCVGLDCLVSWARFTYKPDDKKGEKREPLVAVGEAWGVWMGATFARLMLLLTAYVAHVA